MARHLLGVLNALPLVGFAVVVVDPQRAHRV